jgi:hypothetical protein
MIPRYKTVSKELKQDIEKTVGAVLRKEGSSQKFRENFSNYVQMTFPTEKT